MRLWHKDLVPYLPRLQLVSQWRECCCIAKNITEKGTPNHILVNRIINYPSCHFINYTILVYDEMRQRGYKCRWDKFTDQSIFYLKLDKNEIFADWHNDRYLRECLYNLEEKVICEGIPKNEWDIIWKQYGDKYDLWH